MPRPEVVQECLEQQQFHGPGDEAGAELGEDRGIEARIVQLQAEQILPVDAAADGIRRLPVGEALAEL
jgi:hypothetical protein